MALTAPGRLAAATDRAGQTGPATRAGQLVVTACTATAVAVVAAATALDAAPWLFGAVLAGWLTRVARNPGRRVRRADRLARDLFVLSAAGAVAVVALNPSPADYPAVAGVALVVPLLLGGYWPAPIALRFSLLLSAVGLAASGGQADGRAVAAAVLAAATAIALVALNRLATPADAANRPERIAGEALALLAVAGVIGLLAALLLPPPNRSGSGGDRRNRAGGEPDAQSGQAEFLLPREQLDAGGRGTGKGDEIVFRVRADRSDLWRTMTFDTYDGRRWSIDDTLFPDDRALGPGRRVVPPGVGDRPLGPGPGTTLRQRVRIAAPSAVALPAALRPESVDAAIAGGVADGTLRGFVRRGGTYDVTSRVPPHDAGALRPHDARSVGVPFDVGRLYLPFPGLPGRVTTLATDLTNGTTAQADQVQAVVDWMRANTVVSPGTPRLAPGEDPIDRYLFADRAGSSQQAATATALLLRVLGIPARLAIGYLPGDWSAVSGEFVVRGRHAHAWVEVWFPEMGWVAYDPAGRFLGPEPAGESVLDHLKGLWPVLAALAAVALGVLAVRWWRRRRRLRARPWATQAYERLTVAGSRHGRPRVPSETPAEYCAALAGDVPDRRLIDVGALVTTAAWSGREPEAEARAWADEVVAATAASAPSRLQRWRAGRRRHRPGRPGATGHNRPAG